MADDSKSENIANENENATEQIKHLQNELKTLTSEYEELCIELRTEKERNEENTNELQTLQSKYDLLINENTNTMDDILIHQQNVDELHTLQLKYDELVEENNETMEAMSQLIIASNNKINNTKKEMDEKYKILFDEKQTLLKTVKQLTNEKQLISDKYEQAMNTINELNESNNNISIEMNTNSNKQINELELIIESKDKQCEELKHKMGILKEEFDALQSKYEKLKKHKESFSKYKEKAKNVVNKHKSKAENQINAMKIQFDEINNKYKILLQTHQTLNTQQITLSESITKVTAEKITIAQKFDVIKNKLKKYKTENEQLNKRVNELSENITLKDEKYEKLNKNVNELQEEIKLKREEYEQLKLSKNSTISNDESVKLIEEKRLLSNSVSSLSKENENLRIQNEQLQSWQNNMNSNVMSLNNKVSSKEGLIDKLSKHNTSLQYMNDELEIKVKGLMEKEIQLKNKLDSQSKIRDKREQMLNKISGLLGQCSLFKDEKKILSLSVGVNKLIESYENVMDRYNKQTQLYDENVSKYNEQKLLMDKQQKLYNEKMDENKQQSQLLDRKQMDYNIIMKQLTQKDEKMKKFAVKVKKLQTVRNELQINLENMNNKLTKAVTDSELYQKLLTNIHTETKTTLEKWDSFRQEIDMISNVSSDSKQGNVLNDCRVLHKYFIELLELYSKIKKQRTQVEINTNELEELKKNLLVSKEEVIGYKKELNESTKYINKLTKKLNHCIKCIKESWHYDITKTDFSDLSVTTRLVLEDTIWCLVRWRKNKMEIKHNDEYFWCKQNIFLKKLNLNENEIYLPDLFENKFENQIINNLENKWKAIQRKTDIEINELKLQKTQREDKLKQYKTVLQKQKDKLMESKQQIKQLEGFRDEVIKLRSKLSNISNENINYEQKYSQIEKKFTMQRMDFQNKKLECTEIENKLMLRERELISLKEKFNKEKHEINCKFENEKLKSKKYYTEQLEDIKIKTREMLEDKNKQILIMEKKINKIKCNKETQTEIYVKEPTDTKENDIDINNLNNNISSQQMSIYNIINQPNTAERDAQINMIHERLGRLQELLNESEEKHKLKDQELEYLKQIAMSTPQPEDNPDVNTQYLKNSLLQFFDGKINVKQLLSVATVGLRFDDDDLKKAQNSKLITKQTTTKSSWWG